MTSTDDPTTPPEPRHDEETTAMTTNETLRSVLGRLRETVEFEVMHWSEDFHPGELPTPDTALVSRLNVLDDIDKELARLNEEPR